MARLTKREKDATIETFYGINPKTFEVESVHLTKGGHLIKYGRDLQSYSHYIEHNRDPRSEVRIVFGLTDIISFRTGMSDAEHIKGKIAELRAKAEAQQAAEK